jgi:hypothetical protein
MACWADGSRQLLATAELKAGSNAALAERTEDMAAMRKIGGKYNRLNNERAHQT